LLFITYTFLIPQFEPGLFIAKHIVFIFISLTECWQYKIVLQYNRHFTTAHCFYAQVLRLISTPF